MIKIRIYNDICKIGSKFTTNEGYEIEIVEKLKGYKRKIKILDKYGHEDIFKVEAIIDGRIKNPYHPSVCGIGYFGVGDYSTKCNGIRSNAYYTWNSIFRRCYSSEYISRRPTYKNTTVCEEWHNYQNFAKWYEENFPYHIENTKFQLDKDLLQHGVENKVYSKNTCVFLPDRVNSFLANKYNTNTSGAVGVSWYKRNRRWGASTNDFISKSHIHLGLFDTVDEASIAYKTNREIQVKNVKEYLENLGYLSSEIVELIK